MKKGLITMLVLFISLAINAQVWEKRTEEADIVKGTTARNYYFINIDTVTTIKVYAEGGEWYLQTKFNRNCFKIKPKAFQRQVSEFQTFATFGFLDSKGNIAQPTLKEVKMTATNRSQTIGSGKYTSKESEKISDYLLNNSGWVQIIAPLHFGGELNMKIPCIPDNVK